MATKPKLKAPPKLAPAVAKALDEIEPSALGADNPVLYSQSVSLKRIADFFAAIEAQSAAQTFTAKADVTQLHAELEGVKTQLAEREAELHRIHSVATPVDVQFAKALAVRVKDLHGTEAAKALIGQFGQSLALIPDTSREAFISACIAKLAAP